MSTALFARSAGLCLVALAFLMPGHYLPWATFQGQWVAALGTALVLVGAAVAAGRCGHRVPTPVLALLALLSAAVPPLQWAAGQILFVSDALLPAAYLAAFGLACIGAAVWAQHGRESWLDHLFAAFIVAGAVSVGLALLQWLSIGLGGLWVAAIPPGARPFANLGQPNQLAILLVLALVGAARAHERKAIGQLATLTLMSWLAFGLVMTQSRTGWLIIALLSAWWFLMRRRARLSLSPTTVTVATLLFALAIVSWDALNAALQLTRLNDLNERLQAGPRSLIWQTLLAAVERSPWTGYGFNQVVLGHQAVAADMPPVQRMLENAHNAVLDAALWAGLPFALVWCVAVLAWLWARIRACRSADDWSVLAAVGTVLVHAMVEFPLDHAYFVLPLGLLMGSFQRPTVAARRQPVAWALALPVLALTALLFVIGSEYLRVEQANRHVRLALFGIGDPSGAAAAPPDVRLLDAPREYHRLMLTRARPEMSVQELDWMKRVTQRHAFPPAMMRYALAAGLNSRSDEATLTLKRLCAMHAPPRCEESREAWRAAQQRWPSLAAIPVP